jgi:hypothetical protein
MTTSNKATGTQKKKSRRHVTIEDVDDDEVTFTGRTLDSDGDAVIEEVDHRDGEDEGNSESDEDEASKLSE